MRKPGFTSLCNVAGILLILLLKISPQMWMSLWHSRGLWNIVTGKYLLQDKQNDFHKICDLYSDFFSLPCTVTWRSNLRSHPDSITGLAVSARKQSVRAVKKTVVLRNVLFTAGTDYNAWPDAQKWAVTACVAGSTRVRMMSRVGCYKKSIRMRKEQCWLKSVSHASRIAHSKIRLLKLPLQMKQQELKTESRNCKVYERHPSQGELTMSWVW